MLLKRDLMLKLEVIRLAELEEDGKKETNHLRAKFAVHMLSGIQERIFQSKDEPDASPVRDQEII
jgi:hypothetical protein